MDKCASSRAEYDSLTGMMIQMKADDGTGGIFVDAIILFYGLFVQQLTYLQANSTFLNS